MAVKVTTHNARQRGMIVAHVKKKREKQKRNIDGKLNSPVQVNLAKEEMALGRVACGTDYLWTVICTIDMHLYIMLPLNL